MYIGSTGERGLHHLVWEVVDNSVGEATEETGTTITFWADPTIFETTAYNAETVARRMQEMAFLNKGLTIVLRDERVSDEETQQDAEGQAARIKERTYHYPGGLEDFVKHINHARESIHNKVIAFEAKGTGLEVEIAMQWNTGYSES